MGDNLLGFRSYAIRPSRAIAFEQISQAEALGAHPEPSEAFATLRAAAQYFETKLAGDAGAQRHALLAVRQPFQQRLDDGQTRDFRQSAAERRRIAEAIADHAGAKREDGRGAREDRAARRRPQRRRYATRPGRSTMRSRTRTSGRRTRDSIVATLGAKT